MRWSVEWWQERGRDAGTMHSGVRGAARPSGWRPLLVWLALALGGAGVAAPCVSGYRNGRARIAAADAAGRQVDYSVRRSNRNALVLAACAGFLSVGGTLGSVVTIASLRRTSGG